MSDITGSLTSSSSSKGASRPDDPQRALEVYGERYRPPKDAEAAFGIRQALRPPPAGAGAACSTGSLAHRQQGAACRLRPRARSTTAIRRPPSTCSAAPIARQSRLRILSLQGTTLDKMAKHEEARRYIGSLKDRAGRALGAANLACPIMLTRELPQAEENAAARYSNPRADGRCGQNLALGSACRAASRKPRPSPRAICPPTRHRQRSLFAENAEPQGQGQFASSRQQGDRPGRSP